MKKTILAVSVASLLAAGCGSQNEYNPKARNTQLAAYAGGVDYPRSLSKMDDVAVTSTVNRMTGTITIRNFTNQTIPEPRLWVNEIFVLRLPTISPQASISVKREDLFDSAGRSLATQPADAIKQIELQTERNMVRVKGPQFE